MPSWKRDVPLLFSGDVLLFVPWLGVNRAALAARGEGEAAASDTLDTLDTSGVSAAPGAG